MSAKFRLPVWIVLLAALALLVVAGGLEVHRQTRIDRLETILGSADLPRIAVESWAGDPEQNEGEVRLAVRVRLDQPVVLERAAFGLLGGERLLYPFTAVRGDDPGMTVLGGILIDAIDRDMFLDWALERVEQSDEAGFVMRLRGLIAHPSDAGAIAAKVAARADDATVPKGRISPRGLLLVEPYLRGRVPALQDAIAQARDWPLPQALAAAGILLLVLARLLQRARAARPEAGDAAVPTGRRLKWAAVAAAAAVALAFWDPAVAFACVAMLLAWLALIGLAQLPALFLRRSRS